jgi:hypothetical protein
MAAIATVKDNRKRKGMFPASVLTTVNAPYSKKLAHVPAKHALGLDPRVDPVRRQGHAPILESTALSGHMGSPE